MLTRLHVVQAVAVVTGVLGTGTLMYFTNQKTKAVDKPVSIYSSSSSPLLFLVLTRVHRGRSRGAVPAARHRRRPYHRRAHDVRRRPPAHLWRREARPQTMTTGALTCILPYQSKCTRLLHFRAHRVYVAGTSGSVWITVRLGQGGFGSSSSAIRQTKCGRAHDGYGQE
jgi:predicted ribosomally synthesized peptide with SipW-like signal peptide